MSTQGGYSGAPLLPVVLKGQGVGVVISLQWGGTPTGYRSLFLPPPTLLPLASAFWLEATEQGSLGEAIHRSQHKSRAQREHQRKGDKWSEPAHILKTHPQLAGRFLRRAVLSTF